MLLGLCSLLLLSLSGQLENRLIFIWWGALILIGSSLIALATSLVNIAGTAALLVLLRRRVGRIHFGEVAASSWRIVVAAALAGAAAFGVWYGLDDALGRGLLGQIGALVLGLTVAAAVYLGACRLLHVRELDTILSLTSRFRRA